MAKKSARRVEDSAILKAGRHVEPEESEEDVEDEGAEAPAKGRPKGSPKGGVSKAEAVRQAVANGLDDLDDITDFLDTRFGISMPRPQISAYKAQIKAKAAKHGSSSSKPKAKGGDISFGKIPEGLFDDLAALRAMKDKYGDEFERLIAAIG